MEIDPDGAPAHGTLRGQALLKPQGLVLVCIRKRLGSIQKLSWKPILDGRVLDLRLRLHRRS